MAEDPKAYLGVRLKGRYLIEDHIGSGLSAHAFKAYDTLLQGRVVIKIIKTQLAGVPIDLGESWKEESRKAMQVRGHPHIAAILDLGQEDNEINGDVEDIHFIVTEFVEGKTLRELVSEKFNLEPMAIFTIAHQLLETLEFLQARKLSHDDLHAGNIMVTELGADRPFIKIIDFGMASNTLIPRARENDIHFALNQLEHLCQKALGYLTDQRTRGIIETFAAQIKKAQNFIPTGRMKIIDLVDQVELLIQELAKSQTSVTKTSTSEHGPRRRIAVDRRTPFIGRENDLNRLYNYITSSFLAKRGSMLFVSGEAGIGKTRLVDEALGKVSSDQKRHLFLYHKCQQAPNLPYSALFEAIIGFLDEIPGDTDESKLEVALGPEHNLIKPVNDLINEYRAVRDGDTPSMAAASSSSNTSFILTGFLSQSALNIPVLLFMDDFHLADRSTVEFLDFLIPRIQDSPVVVLVTYRPEELTADGEDGPHPIKVLLKSLESNKSTRMSELKSLEREEADEILSNIFTFVKPSDFTTLSDAVRRMAGGNPFYIFEITGLMEDEDILVERSEGQWVLKGDITEFSVPESIGSLILRRIEKLGLDEILFLRSAALQGDSFDIPILEKMFFPTEGTIETVIESLLKRHNLILQRESQRYAFSHHQVQRVIISGMSDEDVKRGHRDIARVIESLAEINGTSVPHHLVAHHLALAGERLVACDHFHQAGVRALRAQQFHLALDHLKNAADLLEPADMDNPLAADVTLDLIESSKPLGDRKLYERAVLQIQAIADHNNDRKLKIRADLEECIFLRMISEHERSLNAAQALIDIAAQHDDMVTQAAALKEAGTTSYLMGKMESAEEYFHQAAGLLASTDDRSQLARVYNNLGLVCRNTARQGEMIRYFNRALDIFRETGDNIGQRFPLGNLGIVYFERGEYERAFECFSALKSSLGEQADLMMEAKVDFSMGEIYLEIGLMDKARAACERALATFMTIGNRQGESEVLGTLGGIHLAKGDIQIAKGYFERSIEVKKAINNMVGMLHSQITLAKIANMEGRHPEALELAEQVLETAQGKKLRSIELECLTEIMSARASLDSPTEALDLLGPDEEPAKLSSMISSALITFAYKAGELAFQAGDEERALSYIELSGKIVENILDSISDNEWRDAYQRKRERILDTYRRLKPSMNGTTE